MFSQSIVTVPPPATPPFAAPHARTFGALANARKYDISADTPASLPSHAFSRSYLANKRQKEAFAKQVRPFLFISNLVL